MTDIYFENLENIVLSEISKATRSLHIAVAWISFDRYYQMFLSLLNREVKLKIIVHDNKANRQYQQLIDDLERNGAKIHLVRYSGYMHHKFCVIDKMKVLWGSFNWTIHANQMNIEDLAICDEENIVGKFEYEFEALWKLSKEDMKLIRKPEVCNICGGQCFYVLLMEEEGYYQTRMDIMKVCSCGSTVVNTEYFDISVYNNYRGIIDSYSDLIEEAERYGECGEVIRLESEMNLKIAHYLCQVRSNRMGCPIIYAVGVPGHQMFGRHDERFFHKIIWKERGTQGYIQEEYDI